MRNLTITLLLTAISLLANAQSFNEKTFADMMQRFEKDPVKYLQTETVPDFVFVGTSGYVFDLKGSMALYENLTTLSHVASNVKLRQYGNTGIATGIIKHSYKNEKTGAIRILNELFTYIFAEQKGKWQMVSAQHSEGTTDKMQDEAAIKTVIEKETQAFLNRDATALMSCQANKPYSLLLVGEHGNVHYFTNPKADMDKTYTTVFEQLGKPNGDTFKNTDYVIRINGNAAFAYFNQTGLNNARDPEVSHQTRYLERINGDWKIVYIGGLGVKQKD